MQRQSRKRMIVIAILAAVALIAAGVGVILFSQESIDEGENLIVNGGFESSGGGLPSGWGVGRWIWDEGVSYLSLSEDAYSGKFSACVENVEENDARFEQDVAVEPNAYYCISCMVKAEGCGIGRAGAGISVENTFISSEYAYDTDGEWVRLELYGKTGSDQKSLTILCRVGGYSSINMGKAWFDDVEVVRLAALPAGIDARSLATNAPSGVSGGDKDAAGDHTLAILVLSVLLVIAGAALAALERYRPGSARRASFVFWMALIAGVAARLCLAVTMRGFDVDMNCFEGWAEQMAESAPWGFYNAVWCDYPPGYMLLLWPFGIIRRAFGVVYDSPAHWLLVKIIPMTCDVLISLLLGRIARKKLNPCGAAYLAAAYLLNPAVIFNSAVWGQVDSVLMLLLLLAVYFCVERRWTWAIPVYACAALCKPQALMFAPVGLMALAGEIVWSGEKRREALREIGKGIGVALILFLGLAAPFALGQGRDPVSWLITKYGESLGEYNYITVNACNVYQLLNMNWRALDQAGGWTWFAWAAYPVAFGLAGWFYFASKDRKKLFLLCALALGVIFAIGAKMHERYLYPIIGLLLVSFALERDARVLIAALLFSASAFVNESLVLVDMYLTNHGTSAALASFLNIEAAQVLVWAAWDLCVRRRRVDLKAWLDGVVSASKPEREDARLNLSARDWIIMVSITAAYAVLAFVNLGSLKAPQTAWTSTAAGESVTFELEESASFHLAYYGGICNSTFTVSFSEDGEAWTWADLAQYDQGQIFRWLWFVPQVYGSDGKLVAVESGNPMYTAKYIRITAEKAGLVLHEIAFVDADGHALPIVSAVGSGGNAQRSSDAALLCDEQDTVPAYPSYYNSTYFDEIYHARTGYEFEHGLNPYENTHPPLGKVFIMLGIRLFGMTPFGWRFMGALFGVLMLPAMYLLVKQLLKKTGYAAMGTLLLALDSMHFTQTRIATIDTYGVFFILLMYLFMFRYCQMSFYTSCLKKTFVPLGLCGVAMGLGVASKWICIYAALGLAVLFFHTMLRRFLEHRSALRAKEQTPELEAARKTFWRNFLLTGAFCVAMFIVVPALIYYFSYYWFMKPSGGLSIQKVWNAQINMFNYHKGLGGDTHFFRSPWYEWPLIIKPMWYFSGSEYLPEGWVTSISCMGNPAVWWTGLLALLFVRFRWWKGEAGRNGFYIVLAFAAQYLPWVLVPRSTFIYHYFASVPFIIICTVMFTDWLRGRSERTARLFAGILLGAALLLFAAFYPLESGMPVLRSYANLLRWFNWYNF
ncbi:MAG: glycosyltransferase family 39 protein [Clostridia bacterium]|nr:glycosyltransferase family 39 protein [Clostridia bacterium]